MIVMCLYNVCHFIYVFGFYNVLCFTVVQLCFLLFYGMFFLYFMSSNLGFFYSTGFCNALHLFCILSLFIFSYL